MFTAIIITPRGYELGRLLSTLPPNFRREDSYGRNLIWYGNSHVFVELKVHMRDEFDEQELAQITEHILDPEFSVLEFSDPEAGSALLVHLVSDPAVMVDDDEGNLYKGPELVARLLSEPDYWSTVRRKKK